MATMEQKLISNEVKYQDANVLATILALVKEAGEQLLHPATFRAQENLKRSV